MSNPLRAMVIGAGRRGVVHARAARAAGAEVAAVYDPDPERASVLAVECGAEVAASVRAGLELGVNLALITSPPPVHAEQSLACLAAGADLVLEKPIALSMAEALRIGEVAARLGRRVQVCQQQRYTPAAERARQLLQGRKVALAHLWLYRQKPDIRANWYRSWGGGHVVEWAIHPIDFCRYVIGDVETVYAAYGEQVHAGSEEWDNWDAYSCTLRFAGGAVGSVATTYALDGPSRDGFGLDIVAEGLVLRWRSGGLTVERGGEVETIPDAEDPTFALHRDFLHALRTGDERGLRLTYPDALATLATVLACNQSHETGLPVRVADLLS